MEITEMSDYQLDVLVIQYYIDQLRPYGLVEHGPKLTEKGIPYAKQLIEDGHLVPPQSVVQYVVESGPVQGDDKDHQAQIALILAVQDRGVKTIIDEMIITFESDDMAWYRETPEGQRLMQTLYHDR